MSLKEAGGRRVARTKKRKRLRIIAVIFILSLLSMKAKTPQDGTSSANVEAVFAQADKYNADFRPIRP